jgi:hypothetical protein
MFERATREKFRFNSPQGELSTEDLWDLPLTSDRPNRANLNDIAKELNKALKAKNDEESFVEPKRATDTATPAMFDVVKHIIGVKLAESETRRKSREAKEQKDKIMTIMAKKRDESLESASLEDLQAMLDKI